MNAQFLSDRYRVPRTEIHEYRGRGMGYAQIYDQLGREHGHAGRHSNDDDHLPPGQSKDKHGKGKGHDDQ